MALNLSTTVDSNNFSTSTSFTSSTTETTPYSISNDRLFLQTALCQTIAGAFTWTAILITVYHVSSNVEEKN